MATAKRLPGTLLTLGLAALALTAIAAPPASALSEPTALKVCKNVSGLGLKGLWNSNECTGTSVTSGEYAWSWPQKEGKETVYCVLGGTEFTEALCGTGGGGPFKEAGLSSEKFPEYEGVLLLSLLTSTIGITTTKIDCKSGTFSGQPLTPTLSSKVKLLYQECSVVQPTKCEVKSSNPVEPAGTISTTPLDAKLLSLSLVQFTPEAESTFANLEYVNKGSETCTIEKTQIPVKGSQKCQTGADPALPLSLHLIECFPSGGSLTLGTGSTVAKYEGTAHVKIAGDLWWKIGATSLEPTTLKVCKKVSQLGLKGLWNSGECSGGSVVDGEFAWAWPTTDGEETVYCVLGGTEFTEALCGTGGGGPFKEAGLSSEKFPEYEGVLLLSLLTSTIGITTTKIDCKSGTFSGQPLTPTLSSKVKLLYQECSVVQPTKCEVKSSNPVEPAGTISTTPLDAKLLSLSLVQFTPEAESTFANLEYVNKGSETCTIEKTQIPVKGSQKCQTGADPALPLSLHLIECFPSGGSLTLGTGSTVAKYEGTAHVKIKGDLWWKLL